MTGRHDELRTLAPGQIRPQMMRGGIVPVRRYRDHQGRPGIEMPDLRRVDPVPFRDLSDSEQVVDRRGRRAARRVLSRVPKSLAIEAAFRMRPQIELPDDVLRA